MLSLHKEQKTYIQEEEQQRLSNEKLAASNPDDVEDLDWKIKNGVRSLYSFECILP